MAQWKELGQKMGILVIVGQVERIGTENVIDLRIIFV